VQLVLLLLLLLFYYFGEYVFQQPFEPINTYTQSGCEIRYCTYTSIRNFLKN